MKNIIRNPILPGFHPDPSIVRVGDDYYVATSTFEWFPGVQIQHSKDLVNWSLHSYALTRQSQLDMLGNPNSGGVHAPCLSYADGVFYLAFTDVKSLNSRFRDHLNYLVTTEDINGPWSEPVFLNCVGFDPSLFHDDDGRAWWLQMLWDHRGAVTPFAGILIQEYSLTEKRLLGEPRVIFEGTELGISEGPHIYKRDGYYYLLLAEGGTDLGHAVTMARSKSLLGPYEPDPQNPILTSWHHPAAELQKAGHGDLVETPDGEWYMVHLCSRRQQTHGHSVLGRETAIQKMLWNEDGWLRTEHGDNVPAVTVPAPVNSAVYQARPQVWREEFDASQLPLRYQYLRIPPDPAFYSLTERPGYLRLRGQHSLASLHRQTLVARRQEAFCYTASTQIEFHPHNFQQMAGLICYYNTAKYHYLCVTKTREGQDVLTVISCLDGNLVYPAADTPVDLSRPLHLRATVERHILSFSYSQDGEHWQEIKPACNALVLSDEFGSNWSFTGAFVGLCCQDLAGQHILADFSFFEYREFDDGAA